MRLGRGLLRFGCHGWLIQEANFTYAWFTTTAKQARSSLYLLRVEDVVSSREAQG